MIDGNDFIQLAGKLAATAQPNEATCRTAISRAYYGAFHLALAFLDEIGAAVLANANSHAVAQRVLIGSGHVDAHRAGTILSSLHSERIKADYRLDAPRLADLEYARHKVALAHELRAALEACRGSEAIEEIKAGIQAYRRRIGEA